MNVACFAFIVLLPCHDSLLRIKDKKIKENIDIKDFMHYRGLQCLLE